MPSEEPQALGTEAERAAARKYNLEPKASSSGFYDAKYKSNGRKMQIKSASKERADGPGVFRVWRCHLEDLRDVGGSVAAVVVNRSNPDKQVLKIEKVSPSTLLALGDQEGWRTSRQSTMAGKKEARIPWPDVV